MQFRNDSPYPVKITTSAGAGDITVNLMGVKTYNVESVNGGDRVVPTVLYADGSTATNPGASKVQATLAELAGA